MTMARRKEYTEQEKAEFAAQRQQTMQHLAERLTAAVAALQDSAQFKRWLATAAKFYRYSLNNVLLIMMQRPHATRVAGYTTWQQLGRQVRKGEKGITILAPCPVTIDKEGEEETRVILRFRTATVFDISQTDGQDLPQLSIDTLKGEAGTEVYAALVKYAEGQGLAVTTTDPLTKGHDSHSGYEGYYHPARQLIYIKRNEQAHMTKTLIHELGHYLDPQLRGATREEQETVAEATAFMVAAHFGLDSGAYSFPYIACWAGQQDGREILTRCMERIQNIARTLIDSTAENLDPQASAQETAPEIAV